MAEDLPTTTVWSADTALTAIDPPALADRLDHEGDAWAAERGDVTADTIAALPVLASLRAPATTTVDQPVPNTQTGDPFSTVAGSNVGRMVELRGLEPLTFALPARRSPS